MSATFEAAIGVVLKHEGGFVNNVNDPGGATNYGVSLRYLKGLGHDLADVNHDGVIDERDISLMTVAEACTIYRSQWWDKFGYGLFTFQALATKVFDTAVNVGSSQAHKFLQRAVNAVYQPNVPLVVDGVLGPVTLADANYTTVESLLPVYRSTQLAFYDGLIAHNPRLAEFRRGWVVRANS